MSNANSLDEIGDREIRVLLHANELFKREKPELICVTWDYEDEKEMRWFGKKGNIEKKILIAFPRISTYSKSASFFISLPATCV